MLTFNFILSLVGGGMLLLGTISGFALFIRALKISDKFGDETNVGSLWGLFLLGISSGLFILWFALPS